MTKEFLLYLAAMAGVTYAVRVIPFAAVRGKIKSIYIQSFLYYVPYAVLSAMTFPYIFYSTDSISAAVIATAVAFVASFMRCSLFVVALTSAVVAFVAGLIV